MKKSIKKYIYLLNDVTNLMLKKDIIDIGENNQKLKRLLLFVIIILILSLIFNVYLTLHAL